MDQNAAEHGGKAQASGAERIEKLSLIPFFQGGPSSVMTEKVGVLHAVERQIAAGSRHT